jgi:hypothetical protein
MLSCWFELLKTGRSELNRLKQTENLMRVNHSQAAIHAMTKLDTASGQVETDGYIWQVQIMSEKGDGVVIGHGTPIGEADPGVGFGAGQLGTVGRTGLGRWLCKPSVETREILPQHSIRFI